MKIYRVIYESYDVDEDERNIYVDTFFNKENAQKYLKESIESIKEKNEEKGIDLNDYTVIENEDSYEVLLYNNMYWKGIAVWLEEGNTRDEIQKDLDVEKENEYEM